MKSFTRLLVIVMSLGLLFVPRLYAQTPTPVAANGQLKVINRQLSNEAGKPIQLRGMSSHGLHWFAQCYNAGAIQALTNQWGIDVFRAAMYVEEGGYVNNPAGLRQTVDNIVDWTGQNGVYCIIDWHILNPGDPMLKLNEAKEFFRIMAQKHAGKKHVIYEICNEPNGVDWNRIKSYAEQIIPIIRQYDSEAIILVGTPSWSGSPGDVRSNPLTGSNAYNIMYTFHFYAGSHYTQSYIDDVIKTVPLFMSEWGTSNYSGNGGDDYANAQNWVNFMAGQNSSGIKLSWCNWSFCDKDESSAALASGACNSGSWNNTSPSGTRVKNWILSPADDFGPPTPSISITNPANNAAVIIGSNLVISASVSNTTATTVEFYNGATKLGEDATSPYTWTVSNIAIGTYTFTAKAILSSGGPLVSSAVQVTAAPAPNQAPAVTLTAPANNASFTAPASITLSANATDNDGTVTKVEFFNGSTKIGEVTSSPYVFAWSGIASGYYTLSAKATDNQGAVGTSATAAIIISNPGSSVGDIIGPDCVVANDVKVFEVNPNSLANATAFSWWCTGSTQSNTQMAPGKVSFNFGPSFTGGQVCVGINYSVAPWYQQFCKTITVCTTTPPPPPPNQSPSVALTTPTNNATFVAPANITLSANATDTDGSIAKVEFFNGSTKLGEATATPYRFVWNAVGAGNYSLSAKATDNLGAATSSAVVIVAVSTPTPPPTPTADIIGPDCVAANAVKLFELNPNNLANATNFNWWSNGSTKSITLTPGQPWKATFDVGQWFTGGDVCVGVNYSASPWYKQYCKRVTICAGGRIAISPETDTEIIVYPNPTTDKFSYVAERDLEACKVIDMLGRERLLLGSARQGQTITFGDQLPAGHYLFRIQYEAGRQRTVKLLKLGH